MRPAEKYMAVLIVPAVVLAVASLLLLSCPRAGHGMELTRLEFSAAFAPPHNEAVVGDRVARYKAEADGSVRIWKFVLDGNFRLWGVQGWREWDRVGHGFPEAWRNSDWGIERFRYDWTVKAGVDNFEPVQAFVEHNFREYGTNDRYYWMTGLRVRIR